MGWKLWEGVWARAFASTDYERRRTDSYRWVFFARPSVSITPGEKLGTGELFGNVEYSEYLRDPSRSSLELDGWNYGVGYRHRFLVPRFPRARFTVGVRSDWLRTGASRDAQGFAGAFDNRELEGRLDLELLLPWQTKALASARAGNSWHRHRSAVDFLSGGSGRKRRDDWISWRIGFRRALNSLIDIEASYRGTDSDSNVDFYEHDRHVFGVALGVVWDTTEPWKWGRER